MVTSSRRMLALVFLAVLVGGSVLASARSTITFDNQSGEEALVRLAGPTTGMVAVPNRAAKIVGVSGGTYQIFVRYGEPGKYRYTRGEPFTITDNGREYEEVTITLHKVVDGNYSTSPSNEAEFSGGRGRGGR